MNRRLNELGAAHRGAVVAVLTAWAKAIIEQEAEADRQESNALDEAANDQQEAWCNAAEAQMSLQQAADWTARCSDYSHGKPSPADVRRYALEVLA